METVQNKAKANELAPKMIDFLRGIDGNLYNKEVTDLIDSGKTAKAATRIVLSKGMKPEGINKSTIKMVSRLAIKAINAVEVEIEDIDQEIEVEESLTDES